MGDRYSLPHSLQRFLAALLTATATVFATPLAHAGGDSVAVIIGNRDYGGRVPSVTYAINDAVAMKSFVIDRLGYREENIIYLENATLGRMQEVFGDDRDPKGKLWDWARPGRSDVFVFYSGHGAPGLSNKEAYLIPTDVDPEKAERGYSLDTLQRNLAAVKRRIGDNRSLVLMLDACFSGQSAGGALQSVSAGIVPRLPVPQEQIVRISASRANQVANWDHDRRHGLLTAKFLEGVTGGADKDGFGNNDGQVVWSELASFVTEEVRYSARRSFGRDQDVELTKTAKLDWRFTAEETAMEKKQRACVQEPARWNAIKARRSLEEAESALPTFNCPAVQAEITNSIAAWRSASLADRAQKERERLVEQESQDARARQEREAADALARELAEIRAERARLEEERRQLALRQNTPTWTSPANPAPIDDGSNSDGYFSPSFNCYQDTDPDEQAVCRSARLSELDVRLTDAYKRLRKRFGSRQRRQLRDSQRLWIKQRSQCGANIDCLEYVYRGRIGQLGG